MTVLHAGGKFGARRRLHGVRAACTAWGCRWSTHCHRRLEADIWRDGHEWFQFYDHSVPGTLKQGGATKKTGTTHPVLGGSGHLRDHRRTTSKPSRRRLQEMAFLNRGLTITLVDERVTAEQVVDEVVSDTGRGAEVGARRRRPRRPDRTR